MKKKGGTEYLLYFQFLESTGELAIFYQQGGRNRGVSILSLKSWILDIGYWILGKFG
jgi:hypothetical protein